MDGKPIPRLYSGGEMGSFWGWMYNGGGNNAEALCTGQIAGRNAAAENPWTADTWLHYASPRTGYAM